MSTMTHEEIVQAGYRKVLEEIFRIARDSFAQAPYGVEDEASKYSNEQWGTLVGMCADLVYDALAQSPPGEKTRTQLMEDAIELMVDKIKEYPSTPYTKDSVESLGGMLNALEVSMRIDRMGDRKPDEP